MQKVDLPNTVEGIFLRELKNRFLCEVELNGTPVVCYVPSSCHLGNSLNYRGSGCCLPKTKEIKQEQNMLCLPCHINEAIFY